MAGAPLRGRRAAEGACQRVLHGVGGHAVFLGGQGLHHRVDNAARRAARENAGEPRVGVLGLGQGLPVRGADAGFRARQKGRAHLHGLRAQRLCSCNAPAVHDAARGNHRDVYGVHALRHQRQGAYLACREIAQERAPVASGFGAAGAHCIGPHLGPGARFGHGGGRAHDQAAGRVQAGHLGSVQDAEGEACHCRAQGHQRLELGGKVFAPLRGALGLQAQLGVQRRQAFHRRLHGGLVGVGRGLHKQVHAKGPVGLLAHGGSGFGHGGGRAHAAAQHAQATR